MKLRVAYLMQAVFAVLVAVGMSFGASRAMASNEAVARTCPVRGVDYPYAACGYGCPGNRGYCGEDGICRCGYIP